MRSDAFGVEAHRQSVQLTASDRVHDDQVFVEAVSIGLVDEE